MQNSYINLYAIKGSAMIVASDLNGTLTTGSPILAVARWVKKYQPDCYPPFFELGLFISYLRVKLGWMEIDVWGDRTMRKVLTLINNPDQPLLEEIMAYIVESELWPKRRKEAVSLLLDYHKSGAEIIIISAAFEPAVNYFAHKIGLDRTRGIGTSLEFTTGGVELASKLTSREIKLEKLRSVIGDQQIDVALGDTFTDIPLLEQAVKPIAVFPDQILQKTALDRGWQIIN